MSIKINALHGSFCNHHAFKQNIALFTHNFADTDFIIGNAKFIRRH